MKNFIASIRSSLLVAFVLIVVGLIIFQRFVFGDGLLLYRDIGSDSLTSYYADFVHLSDYFRSHGFPSWSFHVGMGQDIAYAAGFLLWEPVVWLPKNWIAYALVYQHLAKVVCAGLLIFRFLQLRRLAFPAPLLGALLVSFSAYMTMGSCWYPFADEVLSFAALLLGIERAILSGRWLLFAFAVAMIGMINPFYLYLCALFLLIYVPARLTETYGSRLPQSLHRSSLFAAIAFVGFALGAVVTFPFLEVVLNSPRGSGSVSAGADLRAFPIFGFESSLHYATAALRTFSNDAIGTGLTFQGWYNYLEAPLTYCGLVCLVLIPQIFVRTTRRQRLTYALLFGGLLFLTVFPWFRYLFWLFKGDYYRTYSLFCVLALVVCSTVALSRYMTAKLLSPGVLAVTLVVLLVILFLPLEEFQRRVNAPLRVAITIYLLIYAGLLVGGHLFNRRFLSAWLVVAVSAVELIHFNTITVSDRQFVRKSELVNGLAAEGANTDAIANIKRDSSPFFRVTRLRQTDLGTEANLNDSMVLLYYGTTSYGGFNHVNYTNFLAAVEAIPPGSESHTRWAVGVAGNFLLAIFAGEKYAIVQDRAPFQSAPQYEPVAEFGRDYLLRNNLSLPLGLMFPRYVTEEVFRQLPRDAKEQVLLSAVVLTDDATGAAHGIVEATIPELQRELATTRFPDLIETRRQNALALTRFSQDRIEGTVSAAQKSVMVLQTPYDRGWRGTVDGRPALILKADIGLLGVALEPGEHRVTLRYRNRLLPLGIAISCTGLLLLAIALWRWPRLTPASAT